MSDLGLVLLGVLALLFGAVQMMLSWRVLGKQRDASRRTRLAARCFSGQLQAAVAPGAWKVPVTDIRLVATQRGYQEVPPPSPDALAFRYVPDVGESPLPGRQGGRERLAAELASADFAWVTLSEIGGTVADVDAFARQLGARVLRSYGSRHDPVLLVGKGPIRTVCDVIPPVVERPRTSARRNEIRSIVTASAVALLVIVVALYAAKPAPATGWALVVAGPVLIAVGVAPFVVFRATGSTTERMTRLVQEFDGRGRVPIVSVHFGIDRLVFLDVAAELGYVFDDYFNELRFMTRWYEGWTVFQRAHHGSSGQQQ